MPFRDRIIVTGPGKPPGKFYIHTSGRELFGGTNEQQVHGAIDYLWEVFRNRGTMPPIYEGWSFMLGTVWGDLARRQRVVDIFGFSKTNVWPGNPDAYSVVVNEGIIYLRGSAISCSEGLRVIGGELGILAETSSLAEYFATDELPLTGLFEGKTHVARL